MVGSANDAGRNRPAGADRPVGSAVPDELEQVREILIGGELRRLQRLERQVRDWKIDAHEVARVLPDAVLVRSTADDRLARALEAPIEKALGRSVERSAHRIVEILTPVIGPLIRRGIRRALSSMLEQFSRALEYSFTVRGLRWRIEAFRTGRPFAEVVMLHGLEYRVEQLFLIHRGSGLLLQHVVAPSVDAQDADMVSAMLTAIRDFVQDAFPGPDSGDVASVQVGEVHVVAQADERAILAAVVRGTPPPDFNERLWTTFERILLERGTELEGFRGDATVFVSTRPLLEDRLEMRVADSRRRRPIAAFACALVGLIALAPLLFFASVRWFERREWKHAFAVLESEPGILLSSWGSTDGRWIVEGLRDPDARTPQEVLADHSLDLSSADFHFESYLSLDEELLARRAARQLAAPAGVALRVADGVLYLPNRAPADWVAATRARTDLPLGIRGVEVEGER